jgi:hypothetical protein
LTLGPRRLLPAGHRRGSASADAANNNHAAPVDKAVPYQCRFLMSVVQLRRMR